MTWRAPALFAIMLTAGACGSTGGATEGGIVPGRAPTVSTTAPPIPPTTKLATTLPPTPTRTAVDAAITVRITASTYGSVTAQTAPGASCTVSSVLPSGRAGSSAGLKETHTADGSGRVSWSYQRGTNTNPGTGTHTVRCTLNGVSATASASFSVP
jgi:hypothetical protein